MMRVSFSNPATQSQSLLLLNSADTMEICAAHFSSADLSLCFVGNQVLPIFHQHSLDIRLPALIPDHSHGYSAQGKICLSGCIIWRVDQNHKHSWKYILLATGGLTICSSVQCSWRMKGGKVSEVLSSRELLPPRSLWKCFTKSDITSHVIFLHPSREDVRRELGVILRLCVVLTNLRRKLSADKWILLCLVFWWLSCFWLRRLI